MSEGTWDKLESWDSEAGRAIMDGMEDVNRAMVAAIEKTAPMCHMRKMFLEQSDSVDGHYEEWWECSICGHTKN
jgi:hypothetical protein